MGKHKKKKLAPPPPPVEPRARLSQAERKQRNLMLKWQPVDRSWMKFARCSLCRMTFACNNNVAHETRVDDLKYKGLLICVFCRRNAEWKLLADCFLFTLNMARQSPKSKLMKKFQKHRERKNGSYAGGPA